MADEPAGKSGEKSGAKVPGGFTGADDPRRGRGPKPGSLGAGRPRREHIEWCQRAISHPEVEQAVMDVLSDPLHPQFSTLHKAIGERGYGRPVGMEIQLPLTREQIASMTPEQLERLTTGEDPLHVLANPGRGGAGTSPAPSHGPDTGGGNPAGPDR